MRTLAFVLFLWICPFAYAQQFKLLRYEEDYASYADSTKTFYHQLKFLPLAKGSNYYLSVGGELRAELDYVQNENWGRTNEGNDLFVLQRYQLHTDLHLGQRVRVFGQLRSGLEDGRKNGPRPIDEDKLNVQNLFVDFVPYSDTDKKLVLRLGRQEMRYGSGRLIDVRDGPNLRQYLDGVKVVYATKNLKLDVFALSDGKVLPGVFDNVSNKKINLWGVYSVFQGKGQQHFDAYYLGNSRANALFDAGAAREVRHTVGTRIWKNKGMLVYNFEMAGQFGEFGQKRIAAFAISSELGYAMTHSKGVPTVKIRADYISGDQDKEDDQLGTFYALYPNGGYFGTNPQMGPANLISLHPTFQWNCSRNFCISIETVVNWRSSLEDGVYNPNGSFRMSSSNSKERYIGTAFIHTATWHINKFMDYNMGLQYFKTGDFVHDVVNEHRDVFFVGSMLRFMF